MRDLKSLLDQIQSEFRAGNRRFTEHAILEASDDDLAISDIVVAILDKVPKSSKIIQTKDVVVV